MGPRRYVGVGVVYPETNAPSPLELQEMVPYVDEYPAGTVNEVAVAQSESNVVVPAVAIGAGKMVSTNVVVADGHTPLSATVIVSVITPPVARSFMPKV